MSERSLNPKGHPAQKGRSELRYWWPDPQWYYPMVCALVARTSCFVMQKMNTLTFEGRERWDALFRGQQGEWARPGDRGLLSFSNHVSLFDDPLLISNLGAPRYRDIRWIAADHINFFGSKLKGLIFSAGKCVPVIRGGGIEQPGLDYLRERLKQGDWVHIFPEGGRSRRDEGRLQRPLKVGIGRLICEARPVLMPFFHYGMHRVQPIGATLPRRGQEVVVRFGEPSVVDAAWMEAHVNAQSAEEERWRDATSWAEGQLLTLEALTHPQLTQGVGR